MAKSHILYGRLIQVYSLQVSQVHLNVKTDNANKVGCIQGKPSSVD